jgi:replication factor A3
MIQESHLTVNHAVEIIGKVQADLSVRVLTSTDFGENIGMAMTTKFMLFFQANKPSFSDFSLAEAVVDATHRHNEIFYSKE